MGFRCTPVREEGGRWNREGKEVTAYFAYAFVPPLGFGICLLRASRVAKLGTGDGRREIFRWGESVETEKGT